MTTDQQTFYPNRHPDTDRFELGQIVGTPGALAACPMDRLLIYLRSHARGNWGCICIEDFEINDEAVRDGNRILSAYPIDPAKSSKGYGDNTVWIITEADRSVTTICRARVHHVAGSHRPRPLPRVGTVAERMGDRGYPAVVRAAKAVNTLPPHKDRKRRR
jgi:hypothetical protein